jgi:arylsulfatase A-like enzyme
LKETREKYRALPRPQKAVDSDYLPEEQIPDFKHNWLLNYAAMIDDTDRAFGDLLDHLEMLGIADNTYVIFTSDNGGGLRGNKPLRGAKADLTEGGIRIPFVVRGPNIPHGKYCDIPTAGWDILPTFYELAGGKKSLPADLDGVSLADAFKQGNVATIKRPNDALIFHFPWYNGEPESAIRIGQYKLLKNIDTGVSALYDLKNDYAESNDLSAQFPKVKASMEGKLTSYLSSVKAETVNELRVEFLGNIENSWLRNAKQRAEKHRTAAENGDPKAIEELAKALKHVKWLHEQVIFTRERMKMKNYAN